SRTLRTARTHQLSRHSGCKRHDERGPMSTDATEKHELQTAVEVLHERLGTCTSSQVATYIPELGKANPDDFGISLATTTGKIYEVGDCHRPFTIQSISKPFTFGMALEAYGHDKVAGHVGVEPSGDAFNAIALQNATNRPFNPMINAG